MPTRVGVFSPSVARTRCERRDASDDGDVRTPRRSLACGRTPTPGADRGRTDHRTATAPRRLANLEVLPFRDRSDAGRQLAARLAGMPTADLVVVALPRGGVPVAFEVATALDVPLDVILVRKLGVPQQPELAMGAIGEDGVRVIDDEIVRIANVSPAALAAAEARERAALRRSAARFRGGRERVSLAGRSVLVIDDGIATGATARAAGRVARNTTRAGSSSRRPWRRATSSIVCGPMRTT